MEIRSAQSTDFENIRELLSQLGWASRVADANKFEKMMQKTSRSAVAVEAGRVLGFARGVCDEVSNGYISMVAVATERQGQGIGRRLIDYLLGDDRDITWVLRAGRGSPGFWEKMGFKPSAVAMERVRRSQKSPGSATDRGAFP